MTQALRVIDTGVRQAAWNVAATAQLVELRSRGEIGDTLRFHRYQPSVLIGHGQVAEVVCDLGYCRANGIVVHRRVTGGGAVLMMPGMLAWDVVVGGTKGESHGGLARRLCGAIANGLADLGVDAAFRPPNDIVVAGRKISGSAGYDAGSAVVLQGTVLIEDDIDPMSRALRLPGDELRRATTCLRDVSRVTCLEADLPDRIAARVAEALGRAPAWQPFRDDGLGAALAVAVG